ncbi:hypothetical protein [Stratiformator vulcanicus]|uniref:Uncharacterized protein n=1 Tax=Stratiformator vulcanicus TaxID=2527980 RepID=A0A517R7N8_9PLAN|nr:hypothetical protein [Stratiformator vulcanicus]QDT39909.1 hypothetical protein Pan189_43210 [Stratiformator vulcanicus]
MKILVGGDCIELASSFPVHVVVGAGDSLRGISDRYFVNHGYTGFTVEAGQHDSLESLESQEATIWAALHRIGCIDSQFRHSEERLARTQLDGGTIFEIRHAHPLEQGTKFRMQPGYYNFRRVLEDELLAYEDGREVRAPIPGRIFMPL